MAQGLLYIYRLGKKPGLIAQHQTGLSAIHKSKAGFYFSQVNDSSI
jgi:hypothetical protein